MKETRFTTGEWTLNETIDFVCPRIDANGRGIAHVTQRNPHPEFGQGISIEEATANAKLMAASKDLLKALIHARAMLEESEQAYENQMFFDPIINAAIKKATGCDHPIVIELL